MTTYETHNTFDFLFLPTVLNDIINEDANDMVNLNNQQVHRRHFQASLDIIKSLEKR